eukprot:TRINITY_DN3242_c0_g1_i3.p1 TRINITY_DN3242_c0_g1~~TRINITY_DN3242_c0_g1_i3.p1  ORF type:complete len:1020 (-),score=448.76 TRINITY_DN3242_c0_g1_i3:7-3015(-)
MGIFKKKKEKEDHHDDAPKENPIKPTRKATDPAMPDAPILDALFKGLLDEMSLPENEIAMMLSKPAEYKWKLVRSHQKTQKNAGNSAPRKVQNTPQFYVEALKLAPNEKLLQSMRLAMGNSPTNWLKQFLELGGLKLLIEFMNQHEKKTEKSKMDELIITYSLRCLILISGIKLGMEAIIEGKFVKDIALTLDTPFKGIRLRALELLSLICSSSDAAHEMVLDSMSHYRNVKREEMRFQHLVQVLKGDKVEISVLLDTMTFINTIINKAADIEDRLALRAEFNALGIGEIISRLEEISDSSQLETQLQIFLEEANIDEEDVKDAYKNAGLDVNDPVAMTKGLIRIINGGPESENLNSILRSLLQLVLKRDSEEQLCLKSFLVIEKFTRGICLQKDSAGFDSDTKITLNSLLNSQENTAKVVTLTSQLEEMEKLKEQNRILLKELENRKSGNSSSGGKEGDSSGSGQGNGSGEGGNGGGDGTGTGTGNGTGGGGEGNSPRGNNIGSPYYSSSGFAPPTPPAPPTAPPAPPPPGYRGSMEDEDVSKIPKKKMRLVNWTKIPKMKLEGTIWKELEDSPSEHLEDLDFEDLENAFSLPEPGQAEEEQKKPESGIVTVVDSKKAQNLGIILSKMKTTDQQLKNAILSVDEDVLDSTAIKQLANFAPTTEELDSINSFVRREEKNEEKSKATLGKVEKLFLTIQDIPRLKERLQCMSIKQHATMKILEMKEEIVVLEEAVHDLLACSNASGVIQIVLRIGNFVNGGTFRGAASAFKLDALPKLADLRSARIPGMTLLSYLYNFIDTKHPELKKFTTEISSCSKASKLSLPTLRSDLTVTKEELAFMEREVEMAKQGEKIQGDRFLEVFEPFSRTMRSDLEEVLKMFEETMKRYESLVARYGEEKGTLPEDFFGIWVSFIRSFEKAGIDMARERERSEREARIAAAKEKNLQEKKALRNEQKEEVDEDNDHSEEETSDAMERLREGLRVNRSNNAVKWSPIPNRLIAAT